MATDGIQEIIPNDDGQQLLCTQIMFVRPAGGGKLAVRDTFAAILLAGVTLTIVTPHFYLDADQATKVLQKASLEFGSVTAFHLDEIKDPAKQQDLIQRLLLCPSDTTK
jgi:hypothetical protein